MARGGARQGKPGVAHLNRTDLNVAKLPVSAAPGQTYGEAGQQQTAQQAVPMGPQPTPATQGAPPAVTPGSLGPFTAPTSRPDEPLTAGAPFGPGTPPPTPLAPPNPVLSTLATLNSLGRTLPPELKGVQAYLSAAQSNGQGQ